MDETNFNHYFKELLAHALAGTKCDFIRKNVLNAKKCNIFLCGECREKILEWFDKPYQEPKIEIDWSKVPVDTPVFVSNELDGNGYLVNPLKRHFYSYSDGIIVFSKGLSSFTQDEFSARYKYAELAKEEDVEKYKANASEN